jgi:hypothetical protein
MSKAGITRNLPDNQYQAAMNADNPSASNPFLTGSASGVVGVIDGSTGDSNTVTNSNAETNITTNNFDFVVAPGELIVGDRIRLTAYARYSTGPASLKRLQIRLKVNSTTFGIIVISATKAIQMPAGQNNKGMWIDAQLAIRTDGAAGTLISGMNVAIGDAIETNPGFTDVDPSNGTFSIDTTTTNTFNFSAQWSVGAPTAQASITFEEIVYEKLRV